MIPWPQADAPPRGAADTWDTDAGTILAAEVFDSGAPPEPQPTGFAANAGAGSSPGAAVTLPTITVDGYALALVGVNGTGTTVSGEPAGWTLLAGPADSSTTQRAWLYGRPVTTADSGTTHTWTLSQGVRWTVVGVVAPGMGGVDTLAAVLDGTDDTTVDVPSITPTVDDTYRVALLHTRTTTAGTTATPPAGWTELADVITTNASTPWLGGYVAGVQLTGQAGQAQAAATGSFSASSRDLGWQVTLAPAGGAPATWVGSGATLTATADPAAFVPGEASWGGSGATVTATADPATFTPGTATWAGSTAAVLATAEAASFSPGSATWIGSTAAVIATAAPGSFQGDSLAVWEGSGATVTATAAPGEFVPGAVSWEGSGATITASPDAGSFTPGPASWIASGATLTATAAPGEWTPGPVTWAGTGATITADASTSGFVPGEAMWAAEGATLTATADDGIWTPGDAEWLGSIGIVLFTADPGEWVTASPDTPRHIAITWTTRTVAVSAASRAVDVTSATRRVTIGAHT